jgi:asparagine synthase (glutamine-hydrolysing)
MVLAHLKLVDRVILDVRTDFDLVGPLAGPLLIRHGILWPLNVYLHAALMRYARGGSLMTGMTGDSLFGEGRWFKTQEVLAGRRKPEPRDVLRLGLAVAPRWVRQRALRGRVEAVPWLRPGPRRAWAEARVRAEASIPWRWDRRIDHLSRRRDWRIANESMNELAAAEGTTHVQPLGDRTFLASVAKAGGARGIGDRTAIMRALFADVLPDPVLARSDKAVFGAAFVGEHTREFAWSWRGQGIDPEIVDPDVLRAAWVGERFNPRASLLLQAAWLHQRQGGTTR